MIERRDRQEAWLKINVKDINDIPNVMEVETVQGVFRLCIRVFRLVYALI